MSLTTELEESKDKVKVGGGMHAAEGNLSRLPQGQTQFFKDAEPDMQEFEIWEAQVQQEWSEERGRYVERGEQVEVLEEKLR